MNKCETVFTLYLREKEKKMQDIACSVPSFVQTHEMHGRFLAEKSENGYSDCLWKEEQVDKWSGVEGCHGMNACVPPKSYA